MNTIPVAGGHSALVDDDAPAWVFTAKWHLTKTGYVSGRDPSRRRCYLHRVVMGDPPGFDVDHIFHNKLDNRREVLRTATRAQNMQNLIAANRASSTGVLGVSWHKHARLYECRVEVAGKKLCLGYRKTLAEAAELVREARTRLLTHSAERLVMAALIVACLSPGHNAVDQSTRDDL